MHELLQLLHIFLLVYVWMWFLQMDLKKWFILNLKADLNKSFFVFYLPFKKFFYGGSTLQSLLRKWDFGNVLIQKEKS